MAGSPPHARGRLTPFSGRPVDKRITPACAGKTVRQFVADRTFRDHPRMRGEDLWRKLGRTLILGSPPHARGRRSSRQSASDLRGITPACAGKTVWLSAPKVPIVDHPRMRGEDATMRHCSMILSGSPPHARGRLISVVLGTERTRITPACAGKTTLSLAAALQPKDHPRMRGEDVCGKLTPRWTSGSPPHARGRPFRRLSPQHVDRITPACAGKTETVEEA